MAPVSAGQEAESAASCSFLAHSTQHLVSPSKLELMGKVHSSIIVLHVWDIEHSPHFLQLPNWQEIKGRSEQKEKNPKKQQNPPKPQVLCQTLSHMTEQ